MIPVDDPRRPMYEEVINRPAFIRENLEALDDLVRSVLPRDACRRWTRAVDRLRSYYAGLASELAFETWTGLAVDVQPSLQGGRYAIPSMTPPAVVFSVSIPASSRTIETVALARAHAWIPAAAEIRKARLPAKRSGFLRAGYRRVGKPLACAPTPRHNSSSCWRQSTSVNAVRCWIETRRSP
jgi:hypothetical protein